MPGDWSDPDSDPMGDVERAREDALSPVNELERRRQAALGERFRDAVQHRPARHPARA